MSILTILVVLVAVGVLLWAVNAYVPMDPTVKRITNVVVILLLVIFLLRAFGVFAILSSAHI